MNGAPPPDAVVSIKFSTRPNSAMLKTGNPVAASAVPNKKQLARARRRQQVEALLAPPPLPHPNTIGSQATWLRSSSMPYRRPNSCTATSTSTGTISRSISMRRQPPMHGPLSTPTLRSDRQDRNSASLCSTPWSAARPAARTDDLKLPIGDGCSSQAPLLHSHASQPSETAEMAQVEVLSVMDAQELLPRLTHLRVSHPNAALLTGGSVDVAMAPRRHRQQGPHDFRMSRQNSHVESQCGMLPDNSHEEEEAPSAPFFELEDDDDSPPCAPCGMLQQWLHHNERSRSHSEQSRALGYPETSAALNVLRASTGNLTDRHSTTQLPTTPHSRTSPLDVSSIFGSPNTRFPSMAQSHLQGGPLSPIEATCISSAVLYGTDDSGMLSQTQTHVYSPTSQHNSVAAAKQHHAAAAVCSGSAPSPSTARSSSAGASISQDLHVSMPPFKQATDIQSIGVDAALTLDAMAADLECHQPGGVMPSMVRGAQVLHADTLDEQEDNIMSAAQLHMGSNADDMKIIVGTSFELPLISEHPTMHGSQACAQEERGSFASKEQPVASAFHLDHVSDFCDERVSVETMPAWETACSAHAWDRPELVKHASDSTVHSDIDRTVGAQHDAPPFAAREKSTVSTKGRFHKMFSLLLCAQSCTYVQ